MAGPSWRLITGYGALPVAEHPFGAVHQYRVAAGNIAQLSGMAVVIVLSASRHLITMDAGARSGQPIFVWPDRSLVNLGIIAFCSMICEGSMFDWSNVYWQRVVLPPKALMGLGLYVSFRLLWQGDVLSATRWLARWGIRRMPCRSAVD